MARVSCSRREAARAWAEIRDALCIFSCSRRASFSDLVVDRATREEDRAVFEDDRARFCSSRSFIFFEDSASCCSRRGVGRGGEVGVEGMGGLMGELGAILDMVRGRVGGQEKKPYQTRVKPRSLR
jgi:hypothetical protein